MVKTNIKIVVLISSLIVVSLALSHYSPEQDSFTGLCVLSKPGFSLLYNGTATLGIGEELHVGKVYTVHGRLRRASSGLWMDVASIQESGLAFPLETLRGAYWDSAYPLILTPTRIRLAVPLNVTRGHLISAKGIFYGNRFYPLEVEEFQYLEKPADGMPYLLHGVVTRPGNPAEVWNGSESFRVYLPHGVSLNPGRRVEILGIAKLYSKITLYVEDSNDVRVLGMAETVPISRARYGQIAEGECLVVRAGRSLGLNCTRLRLYNFSARVGDTVHFNALRRRSSLLCLSCNVAKPREALPNSICSPAEGRFGKVEGRVAWVKVYRNGFGIANVTNGTCWILLKLSSRLGVSIEENESITAYGEFTTYRGMPAFQVPSREEVCYGRHC
ncbi:hypothetical protein [Thermococcus sp.]|uniref:hypothetical protein n=1 Tax=Thermococcus sp. TaxID=35749 RepID=UPI00260180B2|nr:hypothetical protein [Thermococcus sp.]